MGYYVQIWCVCLFIIDVSRNLVWVENMAWDACIVICSQSMQLNYLTCKTVRAGKSKGS